MERVSPPLSLKTLDSSGVSRLELKVNDSVVYELESAESPSSLLRRGPTTDSSTMEGMKIAIMLNDALVFTSDGRSHQTPVAKEGESFETKQIIEDKTECGLMRLTVNVSFRDGGRKPKGAQSALSPQPVFPEDRPELSVAMAESDTEPAESVSDDESATVATPTKAAKEVLRGTKGGSFTLSTIIRNYAESKQKARLQKTETKPKTVDAATDALPRYLLRLGGSWSSDLGIPVAWPPTTDYRCAVVFSGGEHHYIALMDHEEQVGIVRKFGGRWNDQSLFDLIAKTRYFINRPLLIIASEYSDSVVGDKCTWSSLGPSLEREQPHLKEVTICRHPVFGRFLKHLLCDMPHK